MAKRSIRDYLGTSAWILAVLAVPTGAFLLYVHGQLEQVEARNLRNLSKAAAAIEGLVGNAERSVNSLLNNASFACEFVDRQTRLDLVEPGSCTGIQKIAAQADADKQTLRVIVSESGEGLFIEASQQRQAFDDSAAAAADRGGVPATIRFRVRFDKLLSEIAFGRDMDLLLVANRKGDVVGQQAGAVRSAGSTAPLPGQRAQVRVVNLERLQRLDAEEGEQTFDRVFDSTSVQRVRLAGVGYQLMCQPLVLRSLGERPRGRTSEGTADGQADEDAGRWVICGLADRGRGFREALALAPHLLVVLVSVVLLVLFTWPILKLLSMSQRERLRFHDVFFLLIGSLGALMFATVLLVAHDTHVDLRKKSHQSLADLAVDVEKNFLAELAKMHRQLREFDQALATARRSLAGRYAGFGPEAAEGFPLPSTMPPVWRDVTDLLAGKTSAPDWAIPGPYLYFGSAFWMRPCDGQQMVKLTVRRANTPRVRVTSRDYFQKVQSGELWCLDCGAEGKSEADGFYLQAFRSLTTGEFAAALSIQSSLQFGELAGLSPNESSYEDLVAERPNCPDDPVVVAAISGEPVSTTRPVLGPGIQFAIVAADGHVVFHSDERRATFENLFEEVSDPDRLAAIVSSRTDQALETGYSATPHQMFVHPIRDLPWSVVAMADSQILRTNQLEVLMRSGFYLILHLAVVFLLSGAYVLVRGRTTPRCLWPYLSAYPSDYAWGIWMLLVVTLTFATALQALDDAALLWASFVAPIFPVVVLAMSAWLVQRRDGRRWCRTLAFVGATLAVAAGLWLDTRHFYELTTSSALLVTTMVAKLVWVAGAAAWLHRVLKDDSLTARFPRATHIWRSRIAGRPETPGLLRVEAEEGRPQILYRLDRCRAGLMVSAFLCWLVVALLPAFGIARYAIEDQVRVLVRFENVGTLLQLRSRNEKIADYYQSTDTKSYFLTKRRVLGPDVYWSTMFWPDELRQRTGTVHEESICSTAGEQSGPERNQAHDGSWLARLITWIETPELWLGYLPIYNDIAREMRYLAQDELGLGSWLPARPEIGAPGPAGTKIGSVAIEDDAADDAAEFAFSETGNGDADTTAARGNPGWRGRDVYFCPTIHGLEEPEWLRSRLPFAVAQIGWRTALGGAALLILLGYWTRYGARRLFFGKISPMENEPIFRAARSGEPMQPIAGYGRGLTGRARVEWLDATELNPWGRFDEDVRPAMLSYLESCPTRAEALVGLLGLVENDYNVVWDACSDDERIVLVQLAREGVLNPKQSTAVRNLLGRGLLVRDPALRLVNRSFALFVLRRYEPQKLRELERGEAGFGWAQMRWILLIALLAIAAFLWTTQPSVVENILKYLSAAAVGAGALMKIVSATDRLTGKDSRE